MKFSIFYISDLHSRFEKLAQVSTILSEYRTPSSFFFDIGDNADFMRVETIGTKGEISTGLMDYLQCDARVIGNNEGFPGLEYTKNMLDISKTPFITCNLNMIDGSKLDGLQSSLILEKNNTRFLLIGVTAAYNDFYELFKMHSSDPRQSIISEIAKYNNSEYDYTILLSHLGLESDKEIARDVAEIDIIIGGHSHTVIKNPIIENGVIIVQAGCFGEYLGILDLKLDVKSNSISSYQGNIIELENHDEDQDVFSLISNYTSIAHEKMSQTLFENEQEIDHSLTHEDSLTNLLADALVNVFPCDLGLINSGVLNRKIPVGDVSKLDFHEICPSPLNPTLIRIKGENIRIALENSWKEEFYHHETTGDGFRGKWMGNLQVSFNCAVVFSKNDRGYKIEEILLNNESLEDEKTYLVTTSDHLQRGHAYNSLADCELIKYHPDFLKDVLEKHALSSINRKLTRTKRIQFKK